MKLSAEQFAHLAATFNAQTSSQAHERRRAARMDLAARVKIIPVISGRRLDPMHVMICDFSARGVSFVHAHQIEIGRQFILELPRRESGSVTVLCTVMHSKPLGHNAFRIGAEFTTTIQPLAESTEAKDDAERARISASMMR